MDWPDRNPARYRLYGLNVESALQLRGMVAPTTARPDVRVVRGEPAQFANARQEVGATAGREWFCGRRLAAGPMYLRWQGLFEFLISADGRTILFQRTPRTSTDSFHAYLFGQVLSFSLLARGEEPLHGTVVADQGSGFALVGDCGYGKSTLAAALMARGCKVVTDDLLVLRQHRRSWMAQPGIPRLKLFPRVAHQLLRTPRGPTMNRGTEKLIVPLGADQAADGPVPLRAIYVLSQPDRSRRHSRVAIEPLHGAPAFIEVVRASFNLLVNDRERFCTQFDFASSVARAVSVHRLTYPRRLSALAEVCDALLAARGA